MREYTGQCSITFNTALKNSRSFCDLFFENIFVDSFALPFSFENLRQHLDKGVHSCSVVKTDRVSLELFA